MFYRTIRMIDNGIKPVYVFDGKPPKMKTSELEKRTERRTEAEKQRNDAVELGDEASVNKFERRLVKVIASLFQILSFKETRSDVFYFMLQKLFYHIQSFA